MTRPLPEEWFTSDSRINAAIAWAIVAVLVVTSVRAIVDFLLVRAALAAVAAGVAVVPPAVERSWTHTIPWPLLLVSAIPLTTDAVAMPFLANFISGLSIAALGMLVVSALLMTDSLRLTPNFAVFFVVLVALATAGFWALGSAASARYLGTPFVESNDRLMWIFTAAAGGGLAGGGLFRAYFGHRLHDRRASGDGETDGGGRAP